MGRIIEGKEIARAVGRLAEDSEREFVLVSPYINANSGLCGMLAGAAARRVEVVVLCAKRPENFPALKALGGVETRLRPNLHAKAYMNERDALVCSMNLLDFPEPGNVEFGVLFSRLDSPEMFDTLATCVMRVYCESRELELLPGEDAADVRTPLAGDGGEGRCIRCGATIKFDIQRPYCASCFANWYLYRNRGYLEKFCHHCGTRTIFLCINNPLCADCQIKMTRRPA